MLQYGISEYSHQSEWGVDKVRFEFLGSVYVGRGLLKWERERGFHLDAFLDRRGPPLPDKIEFGKFGVVQPRELRQLRMRIEGVERALSAPIAMSEHPELIDGCRLSADVPSILFVRRAPFDMERGKLYGSTVLNVGKGLVFPDSVERETKIEGKHIGGGWARDGINFDATDMGLTAIRDGGTHLKVDWQLSADKWTAAQAWSFGQALADALTFVGGRTVRLVERRTYRHNREYIDRRRSSDVQDLSYLALAPRKSRRADLIDKQQLTALLRFFLRGGEEVPVARHIMSQMAEAARQRTWVARELLCATTLEAALRTAMKRPYNARAKKVDPIMREFQAKYFPSEAWKQHCEQALKAFHRLRHRNAHPNWLVGEAGALSEGELGKSLDDMIRLAWFYGYMILAMAGFEDLEPKFPRPHQEWGPLFTRTTRATI